MFINASIIIRWRRYTNKSVKSNIRCYYWWYEEYASNDKNTKISRVLNGILFTVLGIYDYYKYTNDAEAKLLFDKGINSIKKEISKYNDNGYSYYDLLGMPAKDYHQTHVVLLKKLYNITGEPILIQYSDLWKNLLWKIPNPSPIDFEIFPNQESFWLSVLYGKGANRSNIVFAVW